jgi:hypothetical protein
MERSGRRIIEENIENKRWNEKNKENQLQLD